MTGGFLTKNWQCKRRIHAMTSTLLLLMCFHHNGASHRWISPTKDQQYIYMEFCYSFCYSFQQAQVDLRRHNSHVTSLWWFLWQMIWRHGPLTRYIKLRVVHAPGMPGKFFPRGRLQRKPLVSDPGMHNGTCVTHVPWCMSRSFTRNCDKTFPAFLAHAHPHLYVSGKRPIPRTQSH